MPHYLYPVLMLHSRDWQRLSHAWRTTLVLLLCASPALAQATSTDPQQPLGSISGTVADDTGTAIPDAKVIVSEDLPPTRSETATGVDGGFSFSNVPSGSFRLTVSSPGFADQTTTGVVTAGGMATLEPIRLRVAASVTVDVVPTQVVAEQQIKQQEQQRIVGVVPNFLISYRPDAVPLTPHQKFTLSWRSHLDPVEFGIVATMAGIEQREHAYRGFGHGLSGYAKRYGAADATVWTKGMIAQVILPSLFRQDPRYFVKGGGTVTSRLLYGMSRVVMRRGDNGHAQPNYSGILGSLAAGGLSNLYYPEEDRGGVRLTLENTATGFIGGALSYLSQEFLFPKLTSHAARSRPTTH